MRLVIRDIIQEIVVSDERSPQELSNSSGLTTLDLFTLISGESLLLITMIGEKGS